MTKSIILYIFLLFLLLIPALPSASDFHFAGEEYPPFSYTENGKIKGISVDILREILRECEMPDSIAIYPWARAYKTALDQKNTAVFTTARTIDRENLFVWVGPISQRRIGLYKLTSRTEIQAATIQEAQKYMVGSITGYAAEEILQRNGFRKGKNLQSVATLEQNVRKLFLGRIDMMTALDVALPFMLKNTGFKLNQLEEVILLDDKTEFYYAFNKESDSSRLSQFQAILDKMKVDGRFEEILRKYQEDR